MKLLKKISILTILFIAPMNIWSQDVSYFVKGVDMESGSVSFLETGSTLGFSSENVIINGEVLGIRGSISFTEGYMVYPSTMNSTNGKLDIDVYWSLGSSNFNCIIDWGNNNLEQFKLNMVNIDSYNKSLLKQNELKKNKYLTDLTFRVAQLNEEISKTEDLNKKKILINSILNVYNQDYKEIFQNDPAEIIKLKEWLNEIDNQLEKLISTQKELDSLRILTVRVVSFSSSNNSIDTFMVLKRAASLVFFALIKDSSKVLNNYLDSNFISVFSKKVNEIRILNSTYLNENNYLQICELNIPVLELFKMGQNMGWKIPSVNLSNETIFKARKYEFLKNQEFNAMCEIVGNLHNLTISCLEAKVKKSALINESNKWKAKYDVDIVFNDKINDIRKIILNNFTYFSLSNLDLIDVYKSDENFEKFALYITPKEGDASDIVVTNRGDRVCFMFTNSLSFDLIQEYFKNLDDFYCKQWTVDILNKTYNGIEPNIPTSSEKYNSPDSRWVINHKGLKTEFTKKSITLSFPEKSNVISNYFVNLELSEADIEKYSDSLKFAFKNRITYIEGGFRTILYTYGVLIKYETINVNERVFRYTKPSTDLLPTQLLSVVNEGYRMNIKDGNGWYGSANLGFTRNGEYYEICNVIYDTITRGFWSHIGGGKKGKKERIVYAKPTKVNIIYSIYTTNSPDYSKLMISYLTDWFSYYPSGDISSSQSLNHSYKDMFLDKNGFYSNFSKYNRNNRNAGCKVVKIEKQ